MTAVARMAKWLHTWTSYSDSGYVNKIPTDST